jgi:hypothetical protein
MIFPRALPLNVGSLRIGLRRRIPREPVATDPMRRRQDCGDPKPRSA